MTIVSSIEIFSIVLIVALCSIMPALMPASLPFGVRVPPERREEPVIARVRRDYRLGLLLTALVEGLAIALLARTLPTFVLMKDAILVALLLTTIDYYIAHRRLLRVKAREQWYAGQRQVLMADTDPHRAPVRILLPWCIVNVVLLAAMFVGGVLRYPALPARLPIHPDMNGVTNSWVPKMPGAFIVPFSALLLTLALTALAYYLPRCTRWQLDPAEPEASRLRLQWQQREVAHRQLAAAALFNVIFLLVSLSIWKVLPVTGPLSMLIVLLPLLFALVRTLLLLLNRRHAGQGGSQRMPRYVQRDDDRYWLAGMFYLNRDDPSLFVEKRFGIGWTFNLGHPLSIVVLVLAITILSAVLRARP